MLDQLDGVAFVVLADSDDDRIAVRHLGFRVVSPLLPTHRATSAH
jgi:hypothetical protein